MRIDEDRFDRQKRINGWSQPSVSKSKCLVVGAGALGNEVIKLLVQMGVRDLTLVDYDSIVEANLNRCVFFNSSDIGKLKAEVLAEKAKVMDENARVNTVIKRLEFLDESFYDRFDCAFSCLDNQAARLHLNAYCYGRVPLVDGGTAGFNGKVQVVRSPSACLECAMSKQDYKRMWKKYSCVGEVLDFLDPKMPALATTTSIIAAMQANEFVKMVHGRDCLEGKYVFFDGLKQETSVYEIRKRNNCPVH